MNTNCQEIFLRIERLVLGEKLNFSTTIFESQGRFAQYFNNYAISLKPAGGNPAIVNTTVNVRTK